MFDWQMLQISRRGVAVDPRSGDSYRLNDSATVILRAMQNGLSPIDVAANLAQEFNVSMDSALCDVYEFIANLQALGYNE